MTPKTYTDEEINGNISILRVREDDLLLQRKELNELIRDNREQIIQWEKLNPNQYKAF